MAASQPMASRMPKARRHKFRAERDVKYRHLYRARCSCGWRTSGFTLASIARSFHAQHVRECGGR